MQDRTSAQGVSNDARAFDENQLAWRWDIFHRTLKQWRRMGIDSVYLKLSNRVSK